MPGASASTKSSDQCNAACSAGVAPSIPGVERGGRVDLDRQSCRRRIARVRLRPCTRPARRRLASNSCACASTRAFARTKSLRESISPRTSASRMKTSCASVSILRAELHGALLDERQAEQRDLLERDHRAALARPVRIAPVALDQMRGLLLDPFRLDARAQQSVDFLQIENLPGEQPRRRRFRQRRAGENLELALARAAILTAFVLVPDLRRPARQQAAMHDADSKLAAFERSALPAEDSSRHHQKLAMQLAPFAHAQVRQESRRAPVAQFRLREFLVRLRVRVPQIQHARRNRISHRRTARAPGRRPVARRRDVRADPGCSGTRRARAVRATHSALFASTSMRASATSIGRRAMSRPIAVRSLVFVDRAEFRRGADNRRRSRACRALRRTGSARRRRASELSMRRITPASDERRISGSE